MPTTRTTFSSFSILSVAGGTALLVLAAVAVAPAPAEACGDKDRPCAGGAAQDGAKARDGKEGAGAGAAGGALKAVIDPATGQLVEPDAAAAAESEAAPAAAATTSGGSAPIEVPAPGGGVMAAFPVNRASRAVAHVDEAGQAHTNCGHAAE